MLDYTYSNTVDPTRGVLYCFAMIACSVSIGGSNATRSTEHLLVVSLIFMQPSIVGCISGDSYFNAPANFTMADVGGRAPLP